MKKRWIIIAAVVLLIIGIGIILVLYSTPDLRIGMVRSADGQVNYPSVTYGSTLGIGMSQKAREKAQKVFTEYRNTIGEDVAYFMRYTDLKLNADISHEGGKTVVHMIGSGIPEGGDKTEDIDKIYVLDYKLKIEN